MCHEVIHPVFWLRVVCGTIRASNSASRSRELRSPQPFANIIMEQNFSHMTPMGGISGVRDFPAIDLLEATSPSMRSVLTVIRELAHNSVPVLLLGELGTGKRTVARLIHSNSNWPEEIFPSVTAANSRPVQF